METRFCHMCGKQLQGNVKFCSSCGTPVLQLAEEEPAQPEPVVATPDPEPVVVTPDPEPVVVTPNPEPVVVTPNPEPVVATPDPEPVVATPDPEPVVVTPDPEPVVVTPDPEPEVVVSEADPTPSKPEIVIPEPEPAPVAAEPEPAAPVAESGPVPPVPTVPEETPVSEAPVKAKKERYPRRGAGRTILAILLCFFIFLWSFAAMAIYEVRSATSGKQLTQNLESVVKNADIANIPASQLITDVEDPDISLVEWAIQEVSANYDGTVEASEKDIEEFLEESTFTDFLTDKLSLYLNDIYTGSDDFEITTEEVQTLLEDNSDLVEEVFGTPLLEEDIENFIQELDDREVLEDLEVQTLKNDLAPVYYGVQIGLSYWVVGFFAVLAVLFIILLAKTNKWSLLRTCGDTGITWTVLGVILVLPALVTMIVPDIWSSLLGGLPVVDSLIGAILTGGLIPALILLGVGIVLIVIKVIGKKIVLKSAKKQV